MRLTNHPKLSVIIPTKNEAKLLPRCLKSLRQQQTSYPFEIIVVDAHSTDGTIEIAKSYGAWVIPEPQKGKVFAFRKGAETARGDILCFTEADCVLPPHWINTIATYLDQHTQVSTVVGLYTFRRSAPLYKIFTLLVHYIGHGLHFLIFHHHAVRASNFAVRKAAYKASGGFAIELLELYDAELSQRLKDHGEIHILPDLLIQTSDRRVRGRIFAYMGELFPALWALVMRKPITKKTYADIR